MPSVPHVLIDADVVLDVLARREPFFAQSAGVIAACETGLCRGLVAAHTVTTLFYLLAKHQSPAVAQTCLVDLLRIVEVAAVDRTVIDGALALGFADFEDSVQMMAGACAGADSVVTRNVPDFAGGPLPAVTPSELLPMLC